jgi:hypothetical protein
MAILSTQRAQRLGRLGGKVSAADRKGDREWGRKAQRQRTARAQKRHYPELSKEWARNANRARWGKPLKPLPHVESPVRPPMSEVRVWIGNDEQAGRATWPSASVALPSARELHVLRTPSFARP